MERGGRSSKEGGRREADKLVRPSSTAGAALAGVYSRTLLESMCIYLDSIAVLLEVF